MENSIVFDIQPMIEQVGKIPCQQQIQDKITVNQNSPLNVLVNTHVNTQEKQVISKSILQEVGEYLNILIDQLIAGKDESESNIKNKENCKQEEPSPTTQNDKKNSPKKLSAFQAKLLQQLQGSVVPRDSRKQRPTQTRQKSFKEGLTVQDVLDVSQKSEIKFGTVLPGNIFEESLDLFNKTNDSLVVKIFVTCTNPEFDDYDEYIYSIRKSASYDYNEKYIVQMPPLKQMRFKLALKVPNIKNQSILKGNLQVEVQGVNKIYQLAISSIVDLPHIQCNKELFAQIEEFEVVKVAIKKGKKQESRLPFKNQFNQVINMELEFLDDGQKLPYDLSLMQNSIVVQPKSMFLVNINMKQNVNYQERQQQICDEPLFIRKVLLMRIKNSSLIFHYPLEIELY